jgi:hypothetical protein
MQSFIEIQLEYFKKWYYKIKWNKKIIITQIIIIRIKLISHLILYK